MLRIARATVLQLLALMYAHVCVVRHESGSGAAARAHVGVAGEEQVAQAEARQPADAQGDGQVDGDLDQTEEEQRGRGAHDGRQRAVGADRREEHLR